MQARLGLVIVTSLLIAGCVDHDSGPAPTSGYAHLVDSPIRGLTPAQIEELRSGAGMQLALPAELNGYVGPKHVLDLADRLNLNASQRAAVQALYEETNQEAKAAGERVLDAYEALDQWFRDGAGSRQELENLTQALAVEEGRLRLVHLHAHVRCNGLLTPHQIEMYKDLRGYGGDHGGHDH